jgi:hypothetical protein
MKNLSQRFILFWEIDGNPVSRVLVDNGAEVNILPHGNNLIQV